jgi:hypothetical protein
MRERRLRQSLSTEDVGRAHLYVGLRRRRSEAGARASEGYVGGAIRPSIARLESANQISSRVLFGRIFSATQ